VRRQPLLLALSALAVGLALGGSSAGAATPNDTACRKLVSGTASHDELLGYDACRFDKLDAQMAALKPPAAPTPSPSSTSSPTSAPSSVPTVSSAPTVPSPSTSPVATASADFPAAATTGAKGSLQKVGPGAVTSGTGWQYDSRGWVTARDGAVLDHLDVPYNIDVVGDNVKITNVKVTQTGDAFGISIRDDAANTLVEDSTVFSPAGEPRLLVAVNEICHDVCPTGTTLRRLDVSGASTGVQIQSGLLVDSYIHDLRMTAGDHVNGQTANGGTTSLTIRHNTILNSMGQTDAVSLFQDFGVQANKTVEGNLLAGGGYTIYGGEGQKGSSSNIKIRNNKISTRYYPNGGAYGPLAHFTAADPGNEWTGNVWADGPNAGKTIA
jgi:hypothetical protein